MRCLLLIALLIVLMLAVAFWLAGTDTGFTHLNKLANNHVAGLNIEGASGNLRRGVNAQHIEFTNDSLQIKASQVSTDWTIRCLFKRRFCLNALHIDELDITTTEAESASTTPVRTEPIELPEITLPIAIDISDVTIARVRFQAPGDTPVQVLDDVHLSASAKDSTITIDTLALNYQTPNAQSISAEVQGTVELSSHYPLDLLLRVSSDDVLPENIPEGQGQQSLLIESSLTNTLTNLDIDTHINGLVQVALNANVQPLDPALPVTLSIVSDELGWPLISNSQVLASNVQVDVSGDTNDYSFFVKTTLSGEQVPNTQVNLEAIANSERIALPTIKINALGGSADGQAQLSFAESMVWTTQWDVRNIDPSVQVPELDGKLDGRFRANGLVQGTRWSLKLEEALVDGELRGLPFLLETKLSKGLNDLWFIENLTLDNDANRIKAQGVVSDTLDIKADISLPQLQNLVPNLAGDFDARLNVTGRLSAPDIALIANADVIKYKDILVRSLEINSDIDQFFVDDSMLNVSVNTINVDSNIISDTSLSLTGKRSDHQLTLQANGPQDTAIALALNGELNDTFDWSGQLYKVQASAPAHQLAVIEPVAINWQNQSGEFSVAPHCWLISDASSLCLKNQFLNSKQEPTTLTLEQYSLAQLNGFLPDNTRVSGLLTADVDLTWDPGSTNGQRAVISASIDNPSIQTVDAQDDQVTLDYDNITLNANLTPTEVDASVSLLSPTLGNADIQVQLDPSDPDSAIVGTLALQGLSISLAQEFLPDVDTLDGTLSAEGTLAGTLLAPEYNGLVILDAPVVQTEILPFPVTGGRLTATIAGQSMSLAGDILSNDGVIDVNGRGVLDPQKWTADLSLKGRQLSIQSDPIQQASVNHDLRIVVNPRRLSVTGSIDIPDAVIDVAELPEGAATVSSDIVIIEDIEEDTASNVVTQSDLELAVLVEVSLGDDVTLSAYGLDANLTGDMDVRIRGNNPLQLSGEIRVVDGIFKKYGQDLVANGEILFVGPVDSTRLDIDAVREIDSEERNAGLRIQGTVEQPAITLFTEPADKTEDAILSYLVLGRDINEASDQEADLLATAALALAVTGGRSVGQGVANKLGVQEFGLETSGQGDDTELIVSGRLNDRLLLRYGHGVFDAESTLYLRYDLTRKLYLEAAQGVQESVLDLFYSFSF